ncbi:MAG: chorismate mutase, partial [Ruminococcus sp.]|nr:chorismate mutase [Ruminococcus sp.]
MDKLQTARENINSIDKEMARLFCERMDAVKLVAEHKKEHGIPVFDSAREAEVIKNNSLLVKDEEMRAYYVNYIKSLMDISKTYQHRILEGARIAYCGVEGAFAHIAAKNIFPDAMLKSYPSFEEAYQSVENGVCDSVVLPIENSYAGEVAQVADLMFEGSLFVNGIYDLHITHNLLGTPDADISDITTVISHPQALSQCGKYISEKGFKSVKAANTAMAAQSVADGADKAIAAIASKETAKLYNL